MNPIRKFIQNLFVKQRLLGDNPELNGLVNADALLDKLVAEKKIPGLAITVLKEGKVFLQKGYGHADFEKETYIDPQKTIFRIASISKPIAATALAHMVNDGLIDLDASFYKYVSYFPKKKWNFTIRQLASHTAGIRGYLGMEYGLNKPYSIKESIEIFKNDALLFEPGTDYHYNSYDWVLISLAMQEVSGIPFEKYVEEKVLKPLGMINTYPEVFQSKDNQDINSKKNSSIATFYTKNRFGFRKSIPVNNFYKLAGGGFLSTAEDIVKLGQAYLENKILTKEVVSQFLTSESIQDNLTYYGLGWQVSEDEKGRAFFGHVGNGVGGYSNFFVYPKEKMVFAILVNCTNPVIQEELDMVVNALFNDFVSVT